MANNNQINIQVSAIGDFAQIKAQVASLKASMLELQRIPLGDVNDDFARKITNAQSRFDSMVTSTRAFNTEFVKMADSVDRFGTNLERGKLKFHDYFSLYRKNAKGVRSEMDALAESQARIAKSVVIPDALKTGYARVLTNISAKMKDLNAEQEAAIIKTRIHNSVIRGMSTELQNLGKNTQWSGRQLTVGLTVPLAAFGGAASKAFQEVDKELTRMSKVYGSGLEATSQKTVGVIREQTLALAQELATAYGVAAKDTAAAAADLAATGLQGQDLIKSTREVMRLTTLGELDQQSAIKATIALQRTFKLTTDDTANAVNFLNAVENQTSTSMADLVESLPRAANVVSDLGGSYKDLAAMMVALREAGVPAAEGANAIKSAMASLINPSTKAVKAFDAMGISIKSITTKDAGNLMLMVQDLQASLANIDPQQRLQLIEQLFGKFQFAKMTALINNLGQAGSQTEQVFKLAGASNTSLANLAKAELDQQANSVTGRYRRAMESFKAAMLPIGQQVTKFATVIMNAFSKVLQFINKLGPLKNILGGILTLGALVGPILMLSGLFMNLVGSLMKGALYFRMFKDGIKDGGIKGALGAMSNFFEKIDVSSLAASRNVDFMRDSAISAEQAFGVLNVAVQELRMNLEAIAKNPVGIFTGGGVKNIGKQVTDYSGKTLAEMQMLNPYLADKKKIQGIERPHMFPGSRLHSGWQGMSPEQQANYPSIQQALLGKDEDYQKKYMSEGLTAQFKAVPEGSLEAELQRKFKDEDVIHGGKTGVSKADVMTRGLVHLEKIHDDILSGTIAQDSLAAQQLEKIRALPVAEQQLEIEKAIGKVSFSEQEFHKTIVTHVETNYALLNAEESQLKALNAEILAITSDPAIVDKPAALSKAFVAFKEEVLAAGTQVANMVNMMTAELAANLAQAQTTFEAALIGAEAQSGISMAGEAKGGAWMRSLRRLATRDASYTRQGALIAGHANGGLIQKFAVGGYVSGPGGPKDDKVPAMLSGGEYVIKASSVNKYGRDTLDAINKGYATGGPVQYFSDPTTKNQPVRRYGDKEDAFAHAIAPDKKIDPGYERHVGYGFNINEITNHQLGKKTGTPISRLLHELQTPWATRDLEKNIYASVIEKMGPRKASLFAEAKAAEYKNKTMNYLIDLQKMGRARVTDKDWYGFAKNNIFNNPEDRKIYRSIAKNLSLQGTETRGALSATRVREGFPNRKVMPNRSVRYYSESGETYVTRRPGISTTQWDHYNADGTPFKNGEYIQNAAGANKARSPKRIQTVPLEQLAAGRGRTGLKIFKSMMTALGASNGGQIPAMLSNGEYVMSPQATAAHGSSFMAGINNGTAKFANGGHVPKFGIGGLFSRIRNASTIAGITPSDQIRYGGSGANRAVLKQAPGFATGASEQSQVGTAISSAASSVKNGLSTVATTFSNFNFKMKNTLPGIGETFKQNLKDMKDQRANAKMIGSSGGLSSGSMMDKIKGSLKDSEGKSKLKFSMGGMMAAPLITAAGDALTSRMPEGLGQSAVGGMAKGASLGAMFGPYGAAIGAALGGVGGLATKWFSEQKVKAEDTAAGLKSAVLMGTSSMEAFGVSLKGFGNATILSSKSFSTAASRMKQTIDNLAESFKNSDDPEVQKTMKNLKDALKDKDIKKVQGLMATTYASTLELTGSKVKANAAVKAYLQGAGATVGQTGEVLGGMGVKNLTKENSLNYTLSKAPSTTVMGDVLAQAAQNPDFALFTKQIQGLSGAVSGKFKTSTAAFKEFNNVVSATNPRLAELNTKLDKSGISLDSVAKYDALANAGFSITDKQVLALTSNVDALNGMMDIYAAKSAGMTGFQGLIDLAGKNDTNAAANAEKVQKAKEAAHQASIDAKQAEIDHVNAAIEKEQGYIDEINKEKEARNKVADAQNRQIQNERTLADLKMGITRAGATGDLVAMAAAQSAYNEELLKQAEQKKKDRADASDDAKIARHQAAIDAAQTQLKALTTQLGVINSTVVTVDTATKNTATSAETLAEKMVAALTSGKYKDAKSAWKALSGDDGIKKLVADSGISLDKWHTYFDNVSKSPGIQSILNAAAAIDKVSGMLAGIATKAEKDFVRQTAAGIMIAHPGTTATAAVSRAKSIWDATESPGTNKNKKPVRVKDGMHGFTPNGSEFVWSKEENKWLQWDAENGKTLDTPASLDTTGMVSDGHPVINPATGKNYAFGGYISGPGTMTSDSIPAMLSNGEYVVRANSVGKYGVGLMNAINDGSFGPHYAAGGLAKHYSFGGMASDNNNSFSDNSVYNINVSVDTNANPDEIARTVMRTIQRESRSMSTGRTLG
jgi:TP901 family phage tail tape measure protein